MYMINISAVHLFRISKAFPATKTNHKNCVVIRDHNLPANSPIQRCKLISIFLLLCVHQHRIIIIYLYTNPNYTSAIGYSNEPDTSIHISGGLTIIGSRTKHNKEKKTQQQKKTKKQTILKTARSFLFVLDSVVACLIV